MIVALALTLVQAAAPAQRQLDTVLAVPARARLDLTAARGTVTIARWSRPELRVEARYHGDDSITIRRTRGVVTVVAESHRDADRFEAGTDTSVIRIVTRPRPFAPPTIVDYVITVPDGLAVQLSGNTVDVHADAVAGPLDIAIIAGVLRVTNARGSTTLQSLHGRIEVAGGSGRLFARSLRGATRVEGFTGDVEVHALGGPLDLRDLTGDRVRAISVGGAITLHGAIAPNGRLTLSTQRGTITVTLPTDAHASVDVAGRGELTVCDGFTVAPGPSRSWRRFVRGDGSALISIDAFEGAARICHAPSP